VDVRRRRDGVVDRGEIGRHRPAPAASANAHNACVTAGCHNSTVARRLLLVTTRRRFNILPQRLPGTVEDIVDKLVPELQERGVYRTAYESTTLRDHLELP
jgi:alkanesulfonate monooxygenase SsuD/methylene tetrahydromethanopterin reductase-like flavin-dependent oxidoreductase (luciferase family)